MDELRRIMESREDNGRFERRISIDMIKSNIKKLVSYDRPYHYF